MQHACWHGLCKPATQRAPVSSDRRGRRRPARQSTGMRHQRSSSKCKCRDPSMSSHRGCSRRRGGMQVHNRCDLRKAAAKHCERRHHRRRRMTLWRCNSSNSGSEGHNSRAKELHKHLQQQRGQQASNEVAALTARPVARATDDGGATEARQWTWQQAEQLQLRRDSYSHSNRGNTAMLARARDSRALHTAQTGAPETSSMMHLENRYSRRRHLHHRR